MALCIVTYTNDADDAEEEQNIKKSTILFQPRNKRASEREIDK